MKLFRNLIVVGLIIFASVAVSGVFAQTTPPAQSEYQLLAPLPLEGGGDTQTTSATKYINGIFVLLIGIAGVLAVIMIIVGGIKYMSTDAFSGKSEAKDTIQNAILGLLLALSAWIILNTINPDILNIDIRLTPAPAAPTQTGTGGGGNGTLPGYDLTPQQIAEDAQIRASLSGHNPPILVNNSSPCTTATQTTGCTNVVGLPASALNMLFAISTACGCSITITGGTEGGHQTHGPGLAVFDLRPSANLNNFLAQFNPAAANPQDGTRVSRGGATYTYEVADSNSSGNHWHVTVP